MKTRIADPRDDHSEVASLEAAAFIADYSDTWSKFIRGAGIRME